MLKEIDKAIFSQPVGKLSDIIETKQGYHIVRVIERQPDSVTSFRDAQVEIKKKIQTERRIAAYEDHIKKLKETIPVEILGDASVRTASSNGGDNGSGNRGTSEARLIR